MRKQTFISISILLSFIYTPNSWASGKSLAYTYSSGENNLKSHYLSLKFRQKSSSQSLSFSTSSDDYIETKRLSFAYGKDLSEALGVRFAAIYSKENDLSGVGGSSELSYEYEWNDTHFTSFWGDFEYIMYFEETTSTVGTSSDTKKVKPSLVTTALESFSISNITLGVDHYFDGWVALGASFTSYNYSNDEVSKLDDGESSTASLSSNLKNMRSFYISLIYFTSFEIELSSSKSYSYDASNNSSSKGLTATAYLTESFSINSSVMKKSYSTAEDTTYSVGFNFRF